MTLQVSRNATIIVTEHGTKLGKGALIAVRYLDTWTRVPKFPRARHPLQRSLRDTLALPPPGSGGGGGGGGSQFAVYAARPQSRMTGRWSLKVHDVLAFAGLPHRSQGCLRPACQRDLEKQESGRGGE